MGDSSLQLLRELGNESGLTEEIRDQVYRNLADYLGNSPIGGIFGLSCLLNPSGNSPVVMTEAEATNIVLGSNSDIAKYFNDRKTLVFQTILNFGMGVLRIYPNENVRMLSDKLKAILIRSVIMLELVEVHKAIRIGEEIES